MRSCRPVALLTPADMYLLALFESKVEMKIAVAMAMMPKIRTHPEQRVIFSLGHSAPPS